MSQTGGGNNEARIRIGAQEEVSDSLAKITLQLGRLEQKMKESGRAGRAAGQSVKQGLEEGGKAAAALEQGMESIKTALAGALSIEAVRRFFAVWSAEQRRVAQETERLSSLIASTLGGTGDLLNRGRIQQRLGSVASPLSQEERVGVFRAARDAAPGLSSEEALGISANAIRRVGATGAGAGNVSATAAFGARLSGLGITQAGQSVDVAFSTIQRLGARGASAPQIGTILEELLAGVEGPERESLGRELLSALTVASASGQSPEVFRALAGQVGAARERRTESGLVAFPGLQGVSDARGVLDLIDGRLNLPVGREQAPRLAALRGQAGARAEFLAGLGRGGAIEAQAAAARRDPALALSLSRAEAEASAAFSRVTQQRATGQQLFDLETARRQQEREAAGLGTFSRLAAQAGEFIERQTFGRAQAADDARAIRTGRANGFVGPEAIEVIVRSDGADAYVGG